MSEAGHVLAIDQGTTSTRAIVFDRRGVPAGVARREFAQHYPADGWVEHDPEDIWRDTVAVMRGAVDEAGLTASDIAAIGITNQRETTVVWDRRTGEPVHRAIVWQDRRTSDLCRKLVEDGCGPLVRRKTGLLIDSYFSATKIAWILDYVPGARERAERGELCFGTIDSFLLHRLTGGRVHATDATNASRSMVFDIHRQDWDDELLALFRIPRAMMPEVLDSSAEFGATEPDLLGRAIPITGIAGDQQAATFGQACFEPGMVKSTYGTGCFALLNTGGEPVESRSNMLTTVAYRLDGRPTYALEGSIFIAGAAIKWLRDGLGIITHASQTDDMATRVPDSHGVYLVPAFVGLGAPHWDPEARAAIFGLTLDAGPAHIARAALEAVAFQTRDLRDAMVSDWSAAHTATSDALRVDGGMAANDWLCQFLADVLDLPVERPAVIETTALGAAGLAGLKAGVYRDQAALAGAWRCDRRFEPRMDAAKRARLYDGWLDAVRRVRRER
ncbi:glycerol kinase GlpK [Azospirillum argentinense]|uniref:Glycerol kinase n=1 Tax=Azospirillum brasilense TaxID=192 RepID=A0A4D8Q523_AZOBR|nr:glycerol kinase GlpK [Azospirillum argentinense]QCO05385.1 glycerol kinase [Azospirillum argentinense]